MKRITTRLIAFLFVFLLPGTAYADYVDDFCTGLANTSSAGAEARDAGVTMDQLLVSIQASCQSGEWAGMEDQCQTLLGNLVTIVYTNKNMSPNDLYKETYNICLDGFKN